MEAVDESDEEEANNLIVWCEYGGDIRFIRDPEGVCEGCNMTVGGSCDNVGAPLDFV
jgi:hypothetical protein